jgi:hypothetical protein
MDEPELFAIVSGFLEGAAKARGIRPTDHGRWTTEGRT